MRFGIGDFEIGYYRRVFIRFGEHTHTHTHHHFRYLDESAELTSIKWEEKQIRNISLRPLQVEWQLADIGSESEIRYNCISSVKESAEQIHKWNIYVGFCIVI